MQCHINLQTYKKLQTNDNLAGEIMNKQNNT